MKRPALPSLAAVQARLPISKRQLLIFRQRLLITFHQFFETDLRWSHILIGVMVLIGLLINILLPHGWTVWPFVFAAAMMTIVNEAVDRDAKGVPPLQAYSLMLGGLALWIIGAIIFSSVNVFIFVLGLAGMGYHGVRAYLRQRERDELVAFRRAEKRCIHCGEPIDPEHAYCTNCGEEPDPDSARHERISSIIKNRNNAARARSALTPQAPTASVAKKEQDLLARRLSRMRKK